MSFDNDSEFETRNLKKNPKIKENSLDVQASFKIIEKLGQGGYGSVFNVKHLQSSEK